MVCCACVSAQQKIELRTPNQLHTKAALYDEDNNFLLNLPLTFSITDNNILIMMTGNDIRLSDEQTVWMFSEEMHLANLVKNNRNVSATKSFQQQHSELKTVLRPNRQIKLRRTFDDGYEIIKKNALPVFFEINNSLSDSLLTFYLQFYVAKTDNRNAYVFTAKCKPIEVQLFNN